MAGGYAPWKQKADQVTATDHAQAYWRAPVASAVPIPDEPQPSPAEFRLIAEHLPTLAWMARQDGYITWYNQRWHDYCGTTPEQMEGWGWQSVHDPARLPAVLAGWQAAIAAGEPWEMVFPLRGADGVYRPFLTRVTPLRDDSGAIVRWLGVNTEIGAQVRAEAALEASEAKFAVLTDTMPQMVWSTRPDGHHDYYNAQWYAFTGMAVGSTDGAGWNDMFHPADRDRAWERWRQSLATGEPYEIEYRLRRHDGVYRWTLGRALPVRDEDGRITRWIGTCTDIHDAKQAAEHNELLSRELSHRIKNIFAVLSGLLSLSARAEPTLRPGLRDLMARVAALGRAHDFARPHSEHSAPDFPGDRLHGLLAELVKPYQSDDGHRVAIDCDDILVDDKGATPLALVFHELATNSAKYGALSAADGRVEVTARADGDVVRLRWTEAGGPAVAGAPSSSGFGTQLMTLSVEAQLGGRLERDWHPNGLRVAITVPKAHLHRG